MARKIDKQSKRQRVFSYLNGQVDRPRAEVVNNVMVQFNMGRSYAMTLYQNHRKDGIDSGDLTRVFQVRDRKDGQDVDPYLSTKFVANATRSDPKDVEQAVIQYEKKLVKRVDKAWKMCK